MGKLTLPTLRAIAAISSIDALDEPSYSIRNGIPFVPRHLQDGGTALIRFACSDALPTCDCSIGQEQLFDIQARIQGMVDGALLS